MLKSYRGFILRGSGVDLAVGVVIGTAFGALALGPFKYAPFLTALSQLMLVAVAVYFFVVVPLSSIMLRLRRTSDPPSMCDCPECLQAVSRAASKCVYCLTDLPEK